MLVSEWKVGRDRGGGVTKAPHEVDPKKRKNSSKKAKKKQNRTQKSNKCLVPFHFFPV